MPAWEETEHFTLEEQLTLVEMAIRGADGGVTEDELREWLEWCNEVRINEVIIQLVLRREAEVRWEGGGEFSIRLAEGAETTFG